MHDLYVTESNLTVFQFINDMEKDRQYWGWPSDLQEVSFECYHHSSLSSLLQYKCICFM